MVNSLLNIEKLIKDLPSDIPQPAPVFLGEKLAAMHWGPRDRIMVGFDRHRPDRSGFVISPPSRVAETLGYGSLRVISAANDWFLNSELAELRQALSEWTAQADDVCGIGFSMGGYGCAMLSQDLRLSRALLVSPQYSIFEDVAPWEQTYRKEAAQLDPAMDQLAERIARDLRGAILFDPLLYPKDKRHAQAIADLAPALQQVALGFGGHPATRASVPGNKFRHLQKMVIEDRIAGSALRALHREGREESEYYEENIGRYLEKRAHRGTKPD